MRTPPELFAPELFARNRKWATLMRQHDPEFFERLAGQQNPRYLWIGCSDSRVPANQIVDLPPGSVFVHRNVANLVVHNDLNCLSVLQYAVDVLEVEHVIVCGHYGCGGVQAALRGDRLGLIDNWLRHLRDLARRHAPQLDRLPDESTRWDRLCELNVIEQVHQVCRTTILEDAWSRGRELAVHGWIYGLEDGHLQDLGIRVTRPSDLSENPRIALDRQPG